VFRAIGNEANDAVSFARKILKLRFA